MLDDKENKIADLPADKIEAIKLLEDKLGEDLCLIAVEKNQAIYALEVKLAPDFCSDSRRFGRCILYVFACRNNAESGQKDKQDGGIYFFHWPKP